VRLDWFTSDIHGKKGANKQSAHEPGPRRGEQ
jgi:hypothetical protein